MPISTTELIKAVAILAEKKGIKIAVQKSGKEALIAGASTLVEGLLLGPVGLAIGGSIVGITAMMTQGDFRSVSNILFDLSEQEKARFVSHLQKAVAEFDVTDLTMLVPLLARNTSVQEAVLATVINFVTKELGMSIVK